jgi:hypothetical protein
MKMECLMNYGSRFFLALCFFVAGNTAVATPLQVQGIESPAVLQAIAPAFPIPDKGNIAAGGVVVEVHVDSRGTVTQAKAVSGHPDLYSLCERAAKRWLFAAAPDSHLRIVRLTFVFRIMDVLTPPEELGTIFSFPYKVEIRSIGRLVTTRDT